ncbi:MAG: TRAP transporter small permease [Rubrivivax sp.]
MQLLDPLNRVCAWLAGVALLLMMAAGAADVLLTNLDWLGLQSRPLAGATEFIATMMVVAVFLALPLAQARGSHIALDVTRHARPAVGRPLNALHHALHALFYGALAAAGFMQALQSVSVGEFAAGAIDFPVWPARVVLAAGATLMALQCLADLLAVLHPAWRRGAAAA